MNVAVNETVAVCLHFHANGWADSCARRLTSGKQQQPEAAAEEAMAAATDGGCPESSTCLVLECFTQQPTEPYVHLHSACPIARPAGWLATAATGEIPTVALASKYGTLAWGGRPRKCRT
jgi:hypothetical protein